MRKKDIVYEAEHELTRVSFIINQITCYWTKEQVYSHFKDEIKKYGSIENYLRRLQYIKAGLTDYLKSVGESLPE
jgi:hypothetical protein